jgi:hypothetical protein
MKHTSYFLITPKPELFDRLNRSGSAALSDLSKPVMWSGDEHGKSRLLHSDVELLVKMLFLDVLRRERGRDETFNAVFKGLATTGEYFDSLWSLVRVPIDMSVEDAIADAVDSGTVDSLAKAGNERVNEVLALHRAGKTEKVR